MNETDGLRSAGERRVFAAWRLRAGWWAVAFAILPLPSIATTPEPRNIALLKAEIREYVSSGAYLRAMSEVAKRAGAWIEQRAAAPSNQREGSADTRLAVIIDLDDTLLYNADHIVRHDFGYDRAAWEEWVRSAQAPAIEPVRRVYARARELGVAVIYVTGRGERYREATERNLRAVGCDGHAALVCRPDDWKDTSAAFKAGERKRLAAEGYVIIANLGDQDSDLAGGGAERDFRFPNPFYLSK